MDDVLSRIASPAQEEVICGVRFALWKRLLPEKLPSFSTSFYIVTIFAVLALLFGANYLIRQLLSGENLPLKPVAIGSMALAYGAMVGAALVMRFRKDHRKHEAALLAPSLVGPGAASVVIGTGRDGVSTGRTVGWLWFESGWLRFRGEGFDFDLRREDFKRRSLKGKLAESYTLRTPKKTASLRLTIVPAKFDGNRIWPDTNGRKVLESMMAQLDRSSVKGASLYPPIRSGVQHIGFWPLLRVFLPPTIVVAGLFALIPAFIPAGLGIRGNGLAWAGVGMAVLLLAVVHGSADGFIRKQTDHKLDRLRDVD